MPCMPQIDREKAPVPARNSARFGRRARVQAGADRHSTGAASLAEAPQCVELEEEALRSA
jgi:hypothetical protein